MPAPRTGKKPADLLTASFHRLSPSDKMLVQLLSVLFAPVSKNVLTNCIRRYGIHPEGVQPYTGVAIVEALDRLKAAKLVLAGSDGVRCNPKIAHVATFSAVGAGSFHAMARAAQMELPMVNNWGSSYYRSPLHALRDIRIGFFRKDAPYVFDILARYIKQFPYEALYCHPFIQICAEPFDPEWVLALPESLAAPALREILKHALATLSPSADVFQVLSDLAENATLPPDLHGLYCQELLLRGRLSEAEAAARRGSHSTHLTVLGILALVKSDQAQAIAQFEEALLRLKKESGKRKTFFTDLGGLFYSLALIASGDLTRASEYCAFVLAKREWPNQDIYRLIQLLIAEQSGERGVSARIESLSVHLSNSPMAGWFQTLALYWCGSKAAGEKGEQLSQLGRRAREAGYLWLADEMELTAGACGVAVAGAKAVEADPLRAGLTPLVRLVGKSESWENALRALIKLNRPEEPLPQKAESAARLIWHFEDHGRYVELQPREQKRSANGKWSAGRNAALKRLALEYKELDFLTEQDRAVCACIKQEQGGYGYYGREFYRLDLDRALPLMVGHPQLYLDQAATVRLELVQGEPELQLTTQGETLMMSLFPFFEPDQKICLVKESATRIRVFEAREEYRKISAILGTGLQIPAAAKGKALEAVASLSSILVVHSDIGADGAEPVAGETLPHFHLLPYQDGLKLEVLVRPFGEAGPYFRPGAGGETVLAELEGTRRQAKRDLRGECRRAAEAIAALPLAELGDDEEQWLVPDPEKALELLTQLQALGDQVAVGWPEGARFKVTHQLAAGNCKIAVRQARDWFELDGEVRLNEGLALNLQQLLDLMKQGVGRFVPLGEGEFLALSAELRRRLEDLAAFSEPHGKGFRFHPLAAGAFQELVQEAGESTTDQAWRAQLKKLRDAEALTPVVPSTLQAELRGYQEEGFAWLNRLSRWGVGACLADDMGLGKTVQALAQLLSMASQGPSLVVAPTSVCLNWESEAARFAPTLNLIPFGPGNRAEVLTALKPFDLVICSYGLLQQEGELLAAVSWQMIVLDEAQAIKNLATKRSQAAMELKGAFRMVATGTPVENHLGELWNMFRFINPGLLGSLKQFNVKYASPIEKTQDKKARTRLKKLIQPFILRRTKSQVLEELPSRTEILVKVEMSEQEASLYEALRRNALAALSGIDSVEGKGENHIKILAEIMRLRRACCNPRLVLPDSAISSCKLAAFGEILTELRENRHKALVFSQFVDHLSLIKAYLDKAGVTYQYLDGSTPAAERKRRVDAFQSGEGELFLISLKAGGVGLNLTAADYVIHMDPWWNPAVEDQASDRAHRIGQKRPVTIYRLVTKGTIEEKIVGLHQQKRGLADSLLEETDLSAKVSVQELLALLKF